MAAKKKNPEAVAFGRIGGLKKVAKGFSMMDPKRRSEIAKKAAQKRWESKGAIRDTIRISRPKAFLETLAKEIDRRRKENWEKRKRLTWDPDSVSKLEQSKLLDWIEYELKTLLSAADFS